MDWKKKKSPSVCAVCFCSQTNLVETFRGMFPNDLQCEGHRALLFQRDAPVPADALAFCVAAALTYHVKPLPT